MDTTLANHLKKFRALSGYTQDEVAKALGITRSAYSNYENGDREMPLKLLEKASDLFGCELDVFFDDQPGAESLILASAFRLDDLSSSDLREIMHFKELVKAYIKMDQLL